MSSFFPGQARRPEHYGAAIDEQSVSHESLLERSSAAEDNSCFSEEWVLFSPHARAAAVSDDHSDQFATGNMMMLPPRRSSDHVEIPKEVPKGIFAGVSAGNSSGIPTGSSPGIPTQIPAGISAEIPVGISAGIPTGLDASSSFELPNHNGRGRFAAQRPVPERRQTSLVPSPPSPPHSAMLDRVNQWLDQSQLCMDLRLFQGSPTSARAALFAEDSLFDDGLYVLGAAVPFTTERPRPMRRSTETGRKAAATIDAGSQDGILTRLGCSLRALANALVPEDAALDALLAGNLPACCQSPQQQQQTQQQTSSKDQGQTHFARAQKLGPPDWDGKLVRYVLLQMGVKPVSTRPVPLFDLLAATLMEQSRSEPMAVYPWTPLRMPQSLEFGSVFGSELDSESTF